MLVVISKCLYLFIYNIHSLKNMHHFVRIIILTELSYMIYKVIQLETSIYRGKSESELLSWGHALAELGKNAKWTGMWLWVKIQRHFRFEVWGKIHISQKAEVSQSGIGTWHVTSPNLILWIVNLEAANGRPATTYLLDGYANERWYIKAFPGESYWD